MGRQIQTARTRKLKPFGGKAHRFAFRLPVLDKRITILEGAVRSSKTWALIIKILILCKYDVPGQRLITGVSKGTIKANVLNDLFEIVGDRNYDYNQQSGELRLFETWWRVLGAKDEGSEKALRGATVGVAVSDELTLMPKSFVFMLLSRLSPEGARWYASTNPDSPYHYVKTDLIDNADLVNYLEVIHLGLDDNPNLTDDYKEFIRRSYTGVWHDRFVLGLWVLADGAIYRDVLTEDTYYEDATRPIGLLNAGGHIERWLAVDYGTSNALAAIDIYDDGTTVWAEREYYWDSRKQGRQKTDAQYADDLTAFAGGDVRHWPGVIIDPSAASFRAELINRGFYVVDADNEVADGVRRVSTMLSRKRLRIHRTNNPEGIREMQTYAWDECKGEHGDEKPVKKHDHYPDALRYFVQTRINDWRLAA